MSAYGWKSYRWRIALICMVLIWTPFFHQNQKAEAAILSSRDVVVLNSNPSVVTSHIYSFTIASNTLVGSMKFEYCINSPTVGGSCTVPPGLSLSSAVISSQIGAAGFSIDGSSTVSTLILTRPPAPVSPGPASYTFSNVINQSGNLTVFVRVSTYASVDATGPLTDEGAVVYSTARGLGVGGYVPPYLLFCVGVTVTTNCTASSGALLDFGELSSTSTKTSSSEFSGSTNDPGGFSTTVIGQTMTAGNEVITPMGAVQFSLPGTGQFGMNLRANSSPNIGAEPVGPGTSVPVAQMNIPNKFFFGQQVVANSTLSTDFTKLTASYIVNVSPSQRPGIYNTTLTYIAMAAF